MDVPFQGTLTRALRPDSGTGEAEVLYHGERTRVFRRALGDGRTVVCKEALGPDAAARLSHERRILERLQGIEGVPRLAADGAADGLLATEDGDFIALSYAIRVAELTIPELLSVALGLAQTLAAVHRAGVIHKDVNPSNILLSGIDRRPVLIDYDLATTFAEQRPGFIPASQISGTLPYIAPEQTGRTGRSVDQRTDLYSFGATLFELSTGRPPFVADDPLELIHHHLARRPVAPNQIDMRIPRSLSDIILRLLEKEPDERYQSAEGLAHDLAQLRDMLARGETGSFALGERDFPLRLAPPSRLVGREADIDALQAAFDKALHGPQAVLVAGTAGVGKTALIDELRPIAAARRGAFIVGKFDQYRYDAAAGGITQALRALGRLLLAEAEHELAELRRRLADALGPNAGLIATGLPEFGVLMDLPAQPITGDPLEIASRYKQAGIDLLCCLASPDRPVVWVLDDLQWADASSLDFVDGLLADKRLRGLLFVGAYREGAVDSSHPLGAMLARWRHASAMPAELRLANLPPDDLTALIAEMLRLPPEPASGLARAVGNRTGGNPYETVELLNALRSEGILRLDEKGWRWSEPAIRRYIGSSEHADLMTARIARLPPATQDLLRTIACLGGEVALDLLSAACATATASIEADLEPALEDGLLVMEHAEHPDAHERALRFRHDKLQQAAYESIDDATRETLCLALARRLSNQAGAQSGVRQEHEGIAAKLYMRAIALLSDPVERLGVVDLLRRTASLAGRLADHANACDLLTAALRLRTGLEPGLSPSQLELEQEYHSVLYSVGRLDEADAVFESIKARCDRPLTLAGTFCVQVNSLSHRNRNREALDLGLSLLRRLEMPVPGQDIAEQMGAGMDRLRDWSREFDLARDLARPEPNEPRFTAAVTLMHRLMPGAILCDPALRCWLLFEFQRLWVEHGPCAALVAGLSSAPGMAISLRQDYATGYAIARHILQVGRARHYEQAVSQVELRLALTAAHWFEPLEDVGSLAMKAREGLIRAGDLQNAGYGYQASLSALLECAPGIEQCKREARAGEELAARTSNSGLSATIAIYRQLLRSLTGDTAAAGSFGDAHFAEAAFIAEQAANPINRALFHIYRALAAAIFGDAQSLASHSEQAMPLLQAMPFMYCAALGHLLRMLTLCNRAESADTATRSAEFEQSRDWLARRANDCPHNFGHLLAWADAERAWAEHDSLAALNAFDRALAEAELRQRPWHQALIAERAALFHLSQGRSRSASRLLAEALQRYAAWGATAKVEQLLDRHPFLKGEAAPQSSGRRRSIGTSRTSSVSGDTIDLMGILRASQVLSSETGLDRLKARVVALLGDIAGATTVHFLLNDGETGGWSLATDEQDTISAEEAGRRKLIPLTVLRYAERVHEPLLIEDARRDDRFARDPYLAEREHCSLLVVPVLSQGSLRAMLMLENSMSRAAFTAARIDAVALIAGQLAVSLDNALLYASLERKVAERTEDLKAANQRLQALSTTDALTGLANRRRFLEALDAEWQRAQRSRTPVGLAMVDVDFFKLYNDHYGHLGGDECLRRVARALADSVREGCDLVARYGGEEFVVLLPATTLEGAHPVAERARAAVEAMRTPHVKSPAGIVTVSVGVATMLPDAEHCGEQLIALADAALYEAKRHGRNRVVCDGLQPAPASAPRPVGATVSTPPPTEEAVPATDTAGPPLRALLIEDSALDADLITRQLRRGFPDMTVERVDTPAALDAALDRGNWDLVICDYHLPAMGALPALARVRKLDRHIPFIIVSGAIREETAVEAMKLGADDYVMKSNLSRLVPAIRRELEVSAGRRREAHADQALLDSLELYRALADAMPMGMYRIDREGRLLFLNTALRAAMGLDDAPYTGRSIYATGPQANQASIAQAKEIDRQVMESGIPRVSIDQLLIHGNPSPQWLEITRVPVRDHDGKVVGLQGVVRNVTEQRQSEERLAFERQLLRNLMDHIPDVIYFKDPELRYILINQALARRYRLKNPDEAIGKRAGDFLDAKSAQRGEEDERDILRTGVPRLAIDDYLALPNGHMRWFQRTEVPIRNEQGAISGLVAISRDVTERKVFEQRLAESEERFRQIAENIRDVFYLSDVKHGKVLYVSPAHEEIWGSSPERLYADMNAWLESVHPEDRERVLQAFAQGMSAVFNCDFRILRPDGAVRWVHSRGYPIMDAGGEPYRFVGVTRDITEHKEAERHIQQLNRVHAVLSGINTLIVRVRERDGLLREACRISVNAGQFISAHIALFEPQSQTLHLAASSETEPDRLARLRKALLRSMTHPHENARQFRELVFERREPQIINDIAAMVADDMKANSDLTGARSLAALPLVVANRTIGVFVLYARESDFFDDGEMKLLSELASDIAFALDHLDKTEKLDYLAYYDPLTGLANASLFRERLNQYFRSAKSQKRPMAVALLDIVHFKAINDAFGRAAGDELLKQLAQRLAERAGSGSEVAHLGADRFALALPTPRNVRRVASIVEEQYQACFAQSFAIAGRAFKAAANIGIAVYPDDGRDADTLFRNAEAALKKAKASNERYLFYTQQMTERVAERLSLEHKLRGAIEHEQFVLHYQPKVDGKDRHMIGVEALLRWNDPEAGMVGPMDFVPILEETGLILEVGAWALRRAVRDHADWRTGGLPPPRVAVNVSAIQLRQANFVDTVAQAIADSNGPPGIDLEITESLIMQDIDDNIRKLKAIRDMGIEIAIDDFGTGYSSLAYLSRLPVSLVKIDRSFIITMLNDTNTMTLVSTIVSLAHSLGLRVMAEGVDREEQAEVLRELGCDEMQGYLFSRPVPVEQIAALIGNK